jgi:hypothetical protein
MTRARGVHPNACTPTSSKSIPAFMHAVIYKTSFGKKLIGIA